MLAAPLLASCAISPPALPYDPITMADPRGADFTAFVDGHLAQMDAPGAGMALLLHGDLAKQGGGLGLPDSVN